MKNILTIAIAGMMALIMGVSLSTVAFAHETELGDDQRGRSGPSNVVRLADDNDNNRRGPQGGGNILSNEQAPRLSIDQNGRFVASGVTVNSSAATVTSGVASGSLNVKFFGFNFNVRVNNALVEGATATTTVSDIAVGDKLSLSGTIDQATGVISVDRIKDHTLIARRTGDIQGRIAELLRIIDQLRQQLRQQTGV